MRFGISTHLYHGQRLEKEHLAQIAGYGFETIELFATRSHLDYHDEAAVARLGQWLADTGLTLNSVHAPITDIFGAAGATTYSTASTVQAARQSTVRETEAALRIARQIPYGVMVLHLGTPASMKQPDDNHRGAAVRSVQEICRLAEAEGVKVALEVIPNRLSEPSSLVDLLENELDAGNAGICIDFGHAHMMGDVADALETVAEHVIATHIHDNHGRDDEHLVPYLGSIDWDLALVTLQKIGYDGTYLMELAGGDRPAGVLEEARRARQRFERALRNA
jgi:sugar phosphate isomerase/epimerase